jgi:PAS domain S-box-containing protein
MSSRDLHVNDPQPLQEGQELLRFALETSHTGAWELDLQNHSARRSLEHDRIFGYDRLLPEWTYEKFLEHVVPEDRLLVNESFLAAKAARGDWSFECRIRGADDKIRWIWAAGRHREGANGFLMSGIVQDITERKKAQLDLADVQRRLRAIMDAAPIGISYSSDPSCEHISGNAALLAQFEIGSEDNISASASDPAAAGRRVRLLKDGRKLSDHELPLQRAVAERCAIPPMELEIVLPSGRRWFADASAAPIIGERGELLGGVAVTIDVTARRKFEERILEDERRERRRATELESLLEALTASRRRLSLALTAGRLAAWDLRLPSWDIIWNDEHFRLLGYGVGEVTPSYDAWASRIHPDDRARVEATFMESLRHGGEYNCEYRVLLPDKITVKWVETRGRFENDATGNPVGSYGVLFDITERKETEKQLREEDRRKDEFIATLAHELRNPLAPIHNAIYTLERLEADSPANRGRTQSLLAMMKRQVSQLVRIVDDLLEVARIKSGKILLKKERSDVDALVRDALDACDPFIREQGHKLELDLCPEPLFLHADPVRITQVITNVLNNAAKYTPSNGAIALSTRRQDSEVAICIRDNGIGIPIEMQARIFDLFAQSPRVQGREYGGIGVGLAISRKLVEMHGGRLEVSSEGPGRGSDFTIYLPLAQEGGDQQNPCAEFKA